MTELTNALFNFLNSHQHPGLWNDPEYEKTVGYAEAKQELLFQQLNEDQRRLLSEMLDEFELAHHMEKVCLFQAALSLCRELSGLVRP